MAIEFRAIRDAIQSEVQRLGSFEAVYAHEPKSAPPLGLSAFVFLRRMAPIRTSGLNSTSVVLEWNVQFRKSMTSEPPDEIDMDLLDVANRFMAGLHDGIDLDVTGVRAVDVFGMASQGVSVDAGYIDQDSIWFRMVNVTVPVVVNDVWTQGA